MPVIFVFVASLGVRLWFGQRAEAMLTTAAQANEALLRRANRDLVNEIDIRTRAEEELRQSQKMEALGQLTGGVAHDFNNLLGAIQANLEIASLRSEGSEELVDPIANAMNAVEHGASLTQYLLALARKQTLHPHPIDVSDLLKKTRDGLERVLGKSIQIEISVSDDTWVCLADRAQLEGALLNLALNARDAMHSEGTISIEAMNVVIDGENLAEHPDAKVGEYLAIAIRDTGVGVSPENLKRVWEPFYTTKNREQGTGLGLSTVYGFAKQSGGHAEISSEIGVGTEVRLYLPKADLLDRPAEAAASGEVPLGAGETMLLVEDDNRLRNLLAQILEGLNYSVLNAADGTSALAQLEEHPDVRIVLSDVMLIGGISGIELCEQIRERRPDIKILLMSGYAAEELAKAGLRSTGVELLPKPFTRQAVARKIRGALELQKE
jgi:signal transduction histidine kinase/CheY-like chemotaxis protein